MADGKQNYISLVIYNRIQSPYYAISSHSFLDLLLPQLARAIDSEREREVQESCGKAWHGLEEWRLSGYTLTVSPISSCHAFCSHEIPLYIYITKCYLGARWRQPCGFPAHAQEEILWHHVVVNLPGRQQAWDLTREGRQAMERGRVKKDMAGSAEVITSSCMHSLLELPWTTFVCSIVEVPCPLMFFFFFC